MISTSFSAGVTRTMGGIVAELVRALNSPRRGPIPLTLSLSPGTPLDVSSEVEASIPELNISPSWGADGLPANEAAPAPSHVVWGSMQRAVQFFLDQSISVATMMMTGVQFGTGSSEAGGDLPILPVSSAD